MVAAWFEAMTSPRAAPTRPSRWNTGTAMEHAPSRTSSAVTAQPRSRTASSSSASRPGATWVCGVTAARSCCR